MNRFRTFLLVVSVLFVAFVAVEYFRPQPTNWQPTYTNQDKIPYGTYVLYDALPTLFPGQTITTTRLPIANQLLPTLSSDVASDSVLPASNLPPLTREKASYLFVNQDFSCSVVDRDALLRYVAQGNATFIACESLDYLLEDTLHLRTETRLSMDSLMARRMRRGQQAGPANRELVSVSLVHPPAGAAARFRYPLDDVGWYFTATKGCQATVLAQDAERRPVLVRIPFGRGFFILSSTPGLFSNYTLLRPGEATFAAAALSYMPARQPVLWDEYQKQGPQGEQSFLRVLKQREPLRWALYTGLVGLVLFVVLEARRRQRIIPVLKPLPNTTLLFTRTVASLYRQGSNHSLIADKKIGLFQEQLRHRLQEPTLDLNDSGTRERLAQKAGMPRPQVDELVKLMNWIQTAPRVSDADLLRLSRAISQFNKAAF